MTDSQQRRPTWPRRQHHGRSRRRPPDLARPVHGRGRRRGPHHRRQLRRGHL